MQIKEKHLLEFQRLYKKVYDEQLSNEEAMAQCTAMVRLNEILLRPITKKDLEILKELDKK